MLRKRRTRQHQIEDLGFNHIEREVLLAGFTMQRIVVNDYGYDGFIQIFETNGEMTPDIVQFQLKSTDHVKFQKTKQAYVFDLSIRDLELWLMRDYLMLLILYDAQANKAYFIELQEYFSKNAAVLQKVAKFVRVYLPKHQNFDEKAVLNLPNQLI
jgi:predicted amino acid-binding ACT domain protein